MQNGAKYGWLSATVIIAVAYIVTGRVGQVLAIDPGNITLIWPPSGIALGAAILLGRRSIPGIFLGAVVVNYLALSGNNEAVSLIGSVIVVANIGIGSVLQAVIGSYLVGKGMGESRTLYSRQKYLRFFLIVPVITLVSCSVGATSLTLGGYAGVNNFAMTWGSWWLGDSVGMWLFTPLILSMRHLSMRQIWVLTLLLVFGMTVTYTARNMVREQSHESWLRQARTNAEQLTDGFFHWFERVYGPVRAMVVLFSRPERVSNAEFVAAANYLKAQQKQFFPAALIYLENRGGQDWIIQMVSDNDLGLEVGQNLSSLREARDTFDTAWEREDTLISGPTLEMLPGRFYAFAALALETAGGKGIVAGVVDANEFDEHLTPLVPDGLRFSIASVHASGWTTGAREHVGIDGKEDYVEQIVLTGKSAETDFTFYWDVTPEFLGGSSDQLSKLIMLSGVLATLFATIFTALILSQNSSIRQRVQQQTAALRASERQFRKLIDAAPDATIITDTDGRIVMANAQVTNLFGYESDELVGQLVEILVPERSRSKHPELRDQFVENTLRRQMGSGRELSGLRKDGSEFPVEISLGPIETGEGLLISSSIRDISERLKTREEIQAVQTRLQEMTDSIPGVVFQIVEDSEENSHFTFVSKGIEEILGVTPAQALDDFKIAFRYIPGDEVPALMESIDASRRAYKPWNGEFTVHVPDMEKKWIQGAMVPRQSEDGGIIWNGFWIDATDRKMIQESLSKTQNSIIERNNLFQAVLNSLVQGVVAFDADLRLVAWNRKYLELRDYPEEFAREGTPFVQFMRYDAERQEFGPGDAEEIVSEKLETARRFEQHEYERQRPNGTHLEIRGGPITGGGFVSTYSDITTRKKTQQLIEQSKQRLQDITDNIPASVYQVLETPDGEKQFSFVSKGSYQTIGVHHAELMADYRSAYKYLDDEDRDRVINALAERQNDTSAYSSDYRINHPDGTQKWIHGGSVTQRNPDGSLTHNGFWLDVTSQKQMEAELADAKEQAEAATEAKANFLAAMSHEIRTPMNGVVGMIDLLSQTELSDDQKQMVSTVKESAFALLTIINDILDFSKIESGKLDVEFIPISIRDLLEGVAETLKTSARSKKLRFLLYIDPHIPNWIYGDQVRLRQILFNLVGNAIKFTENTEHQRGRVLIRAVVTGNPQSGSQLRFEITDNGIGLSPEGRARLFRPFSQAENSTTRRFGGTGLGLSICKRLVELMHGDIGVESEYGKGSTFWVNIPFDEAEYQKEITEKHTLQGLRVLLIAKSDHDERSILESYLQHWEAELVSVEPESAIKMATAAKSENRPFNVVVKGESVDFDTAVEICDRIRGEGSVQFDEKTRFPRFVMLTPERVDTPATGVDYVTVDTNPMRRSSLIRAVAIAAGRASPEPEAGENDVLHENVAEDISEDVLILVAEDNPTNQTVIAKQLSTLGYRNEIVSNGQEAYDAWLNENHTLILTDCHMPIMDGYELARAIREAEQGSGNRIPVIAITANALQGEVDRCLDAGMDDYLTKPLEMKKLRETLRKWLLRTMAVTDGTVGKDESTGNAVLKGANRQEEKPGNGNAGQGIDVLDPEALKQVFGDDEESIREVLRDFVQPSRQIVEEIIAGLDGRAAATVQQGAHKLKSAARSVGATLLADCCTALEKAGRGADWTVIELEAQRLQPLMQDVETYIQSLD